MVPASCGSCESTDGVDDQAATNPLDVKTVLQQGGRT